MLKITVISLTFICFSARQHEAFLIYAKGRPGMIKGVALDEVGSSQVMVPITSLTRPTTLDYDVRTQFIYYADIQRYTEVSHPFAKDIYATNWSDLVLG